MATIIGGSGNDQLSGTSDGDFIVGLAGHDKLSGLGGNDTLDGGDGDDTLNGGDGDDLLDTGNGNSLVYGGAGNDLVYGGDGKDSIVGGDGDDTLSSGGGSDTIQGGDGKDALFAYGGEGSHSELDGGDDDDYLRAAVGDYLLLGGRGNDFLEVWGAGNSTLRGDSGNDVMFVHSAEETDRVLLDGGTGNDYLDSSNRRETYLFGMGYGCDRIAGIHFDTDPERGPRQFSAADKVLLGSGLSASSLTLDVVKESVIYSDQGVGRTQDLWHLELRIKGTADRLRIEDYLSTDSADRGLIEFANGSTWRYADIVQRVQDDADYQDFVASHTQTAQLVEAMASFAPTAAGDRPLQSPDSARSALTLAAS